MALTLEQRGFYRVCKRVGLLHARGGGGPHVSGISPPKVPGGTRADVRAAVGGVSRHLVADALAALRLYLASRRRRVLSGKAVFWVVLLKCFFYDRAWDCATRYVGLLGFAFCFFLRGFCLSGIWRWHFLLPLALS